MAKKPAVKRPSRLTEIYLAEKKTGGNLGTAVGKAALEKIDPRQFFNQKGLLSNILPSFFKAYKAPTGTSPKPKSPMSITPLLSTSVLENKVDSLSEETRLVGVTSKITAKNTLVLPMIARDMNLMRQNIFKLVKLTGVKPTNKSDMFFLRAGEREAAYESRFRREGGVKSLTAPTAAAPQSSGVVGGALSMLGNLFKGAISGAGSLLGGLGSVVGGIIGGIGGFLGGAAKAIFSVIGGALSGAGILGVLAAAGVGYVLYQLYENLDLSDIKKKLGLEGFSFDSIFKEFGNVAETLKNKVDELTGGKFTQTLNAIESTFKDIAQKTVAVVQTGMQIMTNVFIAALKDFQGYSENIYRENKGTILAGIAGLGTLSTLGVGAFTPKGALVLAGVTALAGIYGKMTGEKSLAELKSDLSEKERQAAEQRKYIESPPPRAQPANIEARRKALGQLETEIIPGLKKQIEEKESRTGNLQAAINQAGSPSSLFNQNLANVQSTTPTPYTPPNISTGTTQTMRDIVGKSEGGTASYDASFRHGKAGGDPSISTKYGGRTLSQLSIGEVLEYSKSRGKNEGAVGRYQFMSSTLEGLLSEAKLSKSDIFSPANQDKLYDVLTRRNAYILQRYGIEPTPQNLHLAHAVGAVGASKLLDPSNQSKNALDVLGFERQSAEAKTNPQLNKPVSEYIASITGKYSSQTLAAASPISPSTPVIDASVPSTPGLMDRFKSMFTSDGGKLNAATIEVAQARVQIGSAPIIVPPPAVNVQAPQVQAGGGGGMMAASSVVDTEFMKLLVGRTVTI